MLKRLLLLISGILACAFPVHHWLPDTPVQTQTQECLPEKILFTQDNGCVNDGSFEFCIPVEHLHALLKVAPTAYCMQESSGRIGCERTSEYLCLVETEGMCDTQEAMNDHGWQMVCAISMLLFVQKIGPTWFE